MEPGKLDLQDVITVAEFRAALRKFLRRSELVADSCGLTPQRYLLLLMIKGASDGRVTYLRLTPEGERRLACSFTGLSAERTALYEAVGALRAR